MPECRFAAARVRSVWLALALVPVSALFSALCLALAAFARSTKEGQYYLMPLLLITHAAGRPADVARRGVEPGQQPDPGHRRRAAAAEPAGRELLEALQFCCRWSAVTLACCLLAIRWAVDQFNSESVLFRESERLDLRSLAAAPVARPPADADRFGGRVLRRVDPGGPVLHELDCHGSHRSFRAFRRDRRW